MNNLTDDQIFELLQSNPQLHNHELAPALCLDFYQLTTIYSHFENNTHDTKVTFDYYFRKSPFNKNSFAFSAGLDHLIQYINRLRFTNYQIEYLRKQNRFSEDFLNFLKEYRFSGDMRALEEGTLTGAEVRGVILECDVVSAHIIESHLLNTKNSETNWMTLAAKMKHAAKNDRLWEGGLRRAQGIDASVWSARAGYIAGMAGTSNVEAGFKFGLPIVGTHPHAWIQFFDSEYKAFEAYYRANPQNTSLLVDTFDVLNSGVPNAIKIAKLAESEGNKIKGIRIDSGDLAYLSREARKMLDEAELEYISITASDSLNVKLINSIKQQGGAMDDWLIGTDYVTSRRDPALGGVFKLVAIENKFGEKDYNITREKIIEIIGEGDSQGKFKETLNRWIPKIKISDNPEKVLLPGVKKQYRIIDNDTDKHIADYICLEHEVLDTSKPFKLFDPIYKFRKKTIKNYRVVDLLTPIFKNGKLIYKQKSLEEMRDYVNHQKNLLWEEQFRDENPSPYYVNISEELLDLRDKLIELERSKLN